MSNATILIQNLTAGPLSIDTKVGFKKPIRALLQAKGTLTSSGKAADSVDVGDVAGLSVLNTDPGIRALLDHLDPTTGLPSPRIALLITRGTNDIDGADSTEVLDASGMEDASPRLLVRIAAGSAGARDVTLYNANFPYAAKLVDAQIMVDTAIAGTLTVRDALAGGGNALTQAMSTSAAGRVRDNGTGETAGSGIVPSLAKGSSLIANMTAGNAACTLILSFARVS